MGQQTELANTDDIVFLRSLGSSCAIAFPCVQLWMKHFDFIGAIVCVCAGGTLIFGLT